MGPKHRDGSRWSTCLTVPVGHLNDDLLADACSETKCIGVPRRVYSAVRPTEKVPILNSHIRGFRSTVYWLLRAPIRGPNEHGCTHEDSDIAYRHGGSSTSFLGLFRKFAAFCTSNKRLSTERIEDVEDIEDQLATDWSGLSVIGHSQL